MSDLHRDIAVAASDKLYRIRQLAERDPDNPLASRILGILREDPVIGVRDWRGSDRTT